MSKEGGGGDKGVSVTGQGKHGIEHLSPIIKYKKLYV
jgi:hypothetical protein